MKVKILTFAVAAALLCCLSGCNAAPPPTPVSLTLTDTAGTEVATTLTLFKGESASLSALPSEQVPGTLTAECSGSMAKVDVNGMDVTLTALDKGETEVVLTFTPEDPKRPVTHQTVSIKVALATQKFSVTPADLPQIIVLETLEDIVAKHTAQSDSLAALGEEAEEVEVLPVPTSVLIPSDDEDVADIPYPYTPTKMARCPLCVTAWPLWSW